MSGNFWIDLRKGDSVITAWDKLKLGGVVFPGLCQIAPEVSCETDIAKWLKKLATKTTPAEFIITLTDKGYVPGIVRATIMVWEEDQWEDLKETLPQFSPRKKAFTALADDATATRTKGAGRDAFDITHPATALLGIDSVIVTKVGLPQLIDQTLYVDMSFMQYYPQTGHRVLHSSGGSLNGRGLEPVPPSGAAGIK